MQCKCGCGKEFIPSRSTIWRLKRGNDAGYLHGHTQRGERNSRWRGGRARTESGYVLIAKPNHLNARKSGYILEHRFVMSEHLGRPLTESEDVHHINGDRSDNRLENLILLAHRSHVCNHLYKRKGEIRTQLIEVICRGCGKTFLARPGTPARKRRQYHSKECEKQNQYGENAKHLKISNSQIEKIRALAGIMTHRALAIRFSISKTHVGRILRHECR